MRIGVLALQGDFREHLQTLTALGVEAVPIRLPRHVANLDGLIIPGGESTAIGKLMVQYDLVAPLRAVIAAGLPVWGTCAGLILLAKSTDNALAGQPLLAAMDIHVARNAFGSQRESFTTQIQLPAIGPAPFRAVFIRAPVVVATGPEVEVLARLDDESHAIVAVRQHQLVGTAFHPEMSGDARFHDYFLTIVREGAQRPAASA